MDVSAQNFVNYLCAAAGAIPPDESGIYLADYHKSNLVEKFWTGTELVDQYTIARDVRGNTPALYILDGDERYVFAVDATNILRRYKFNEDDDEWAEAGLGEQTITVPTSSKLSGGIVDGNQFIFFEDDRTAPKGDGESEANLEGDGECQLQVLKISGEGECQQLPSIGLAGQKGAPHAALVTDDGLLHLLYIHKDGSIHHLDKELDADEFNDVLIPGSALEEDQVSNFLPVLFEDGRVGIYVLSFERKLMLVDKDGTKTLLGDVKVDGTFVAASSEECVNEMMSLGTKAVKAASGWTAKAKK